MTSFVLFLFEVLEEPEQMAKNKLQYILLLLLGKPLALILLCLLAFVVFSWFLTFFGLFFILESFVEGNGILAYIIIAIDLVLLLRFLNNKLEIFQLKNQPGG